MYDNRAIKPYKNRGLGEQQNVGEKSTSILYNSINHHAGISHKNRRHGKLGLELNLLHYIYDPMGVIEGDLQV